MSTSSNEQRFRTFGDTFGKGAPAFLHVADTGVIFTNGDGQSQTGAWRAVKPTDLAANINVSGLTVSVSSVAVTGGGTFTPTTIIITGSQQIISAGYKAASVAIISGSAYINGVGPFLQGASFSYGGYNGYTSTNALVVGCTGSEAAPCSTYVLWET